MVKYLLMIIDAILNVLRNYLSMIHEPIHRSLTRRPVTRLGYHFVNNLMKEDPHNFRELHRMYPNVFLKLCNIIREGASLEDTRFVSVEEMVATFLLIVGHNDRYCNVRQRFNRSHFATSTNFNKVLKALNTIAPQLMVKPGGVSPKISESTRFYPYFKDCVGAVDGTHIPAMVRGREISSYRNRHGFNSQNVLAACSAHDSKLLNDALSRRNGLELPQGIYIHHYSKYFLVDCGFANRRQFLAPLRGFRYHLKDFDGEGRHPRNANELFNLRHSSLRNSRFTIFKVAAPFSFQTQAELVLACAGLHNFLRKECRSDEFPVESTDDQFSDMDDHVYEPNLLSQQQQREEANNWRATIANAMWNNRPRNTTTNEEEGNNKEEGDNEEENDEEHMHL
ncbi:hypothetical protein DCAR_0830695 [Daucus carota subsp. sativus]|uniref:DUF8040 domain-containing protein n=1 Tax=Daucus carota subsp. sativus TaxID=79200 RepID=A0AAF0XNS3_DAUCS|nr:hypothetical protein DCAR_0830695 [Daucus carota subsp. sativus]